MLTFACYILIDDNHQLTPDKVFVSIALFDIMRVPLGLLPLIIVFTAQVRYYKKCLSCCTCELSRIKHNASPHKIYSAAWGRLAAVTSWLWTLEVVGSLTYKAAGYGDDFGGRQSWFNNSLYLLFLKFINFFSGF